MSVRVVIVQEYVPGYRVPFFEALQEAGKDRGYEVIVAAGSPNAELAQRNDASAFPLVRIPQREWRLFGRRIVVRRTSSATRGADLVVFEQARRNIDAYRLLLPWRRQPIALWGHGRDFVQAPGRVARALLDLLSRRADHVFVYTELGAEHLRSIGIGEDRITEVRNSTDSQGVTERIAAVHESVSTAFRSQHGLQGRTALYLGGLDTSKRIDFLLAAAHAAHKQDPYFVLLIGGNGQQSDLVRNEAERHSFIRYLGPAHGMDQAIALQACQILAVPGRVGLIAVDSIASGKPIVTTSDAEHAPELGYLQADRTVVITSGDPQVYASTMLEIMRSKSTLSEMQAALIELQAETGTTPMARRFADGIDRVLGIGVDETR